MSEVSDTVGPDFHELKANLWFTEHGLSPYWFVTNLLINEFDGYHERNLELEDGDWRARLNYHKSGFAARSQDPIDGRLYEVDISLDGPREKKASFNISPRFEDLQKAESGEPASVPWTGGEGFDVHIQGSNLDADRYPQLLRTAIEAFAHDAGTDVNSAYFRNPDSGSSISTVELYVRLYRQYAKKLVRSDGPFYRLMHLLANEEDASWVYKGDNEDVVGYRHAFDLGPTAAPRAASGHSYGRRHKVYHPKHARKEETEDDPLSSPKYGVAFHASNNEGKVTDQQSESVPWNDRENLFQELEESLINMLRWADIPVSADPTVFRDDDWHFDVSPTERSIAALDDPTPEIEAEQDHLIMRVLSDLRPSTSAAAKQLATDGGQHVDELAEETGYSLRQVYRAIEELGDLVVNDNGLVRWSSKKVKEEIASLVDAYQNLTMSAADRLAHLADQQVVAAADSSLQLWMDKYGAEFFEMSTADSEGTIRFDTVLSALKSGSLPNLEDVLQEGLDAWKSVGRDAERFLDLAYEADEVNGAPNSGTVRSVLGPDDPNDRLFPAG